MYIDNFGFLDAEHRARIDFEKALQRGSHRRFALIFSRPSKGMPAFDDVREKIAFGNQRDKGIHTVSINNIVGSVGRSDDFDEHFMPRRRHNQLRWQNIAIAKYRGVALPPVELIKIGRFYFVEDGNHRISVARSQGEEFLDAHITEITPSQNMRITTIVNTVKDNKK